MCKSRCRVLVTTLALSLLASPVVVAAEPPPPAPAPAKAAGSERPGKAAPKIRKVKARPPAAPATPTATARHLPTSVGSAAVSPFAPTTPQVARAFEDVRRKQIGYA